MNILVLFKWNPNRLISAMMKKKGEGTLWRWCFVAPIKGLGTLESPETGDIGMVQLLSLTLALCQVSLADLPERDVRQTLPLSDTRVIGVVNTKAALALQNRIESLADELAPGWKTRVTEPDDNNSYQLIYNRTTVCINSGYTGICLSPRSGNLYRVGFSQKWKVTSQPAVSVDECYRRAKLFYSTVGGKYELSAPIYSSSDDYNLAGDPVSVHFAFELVVPGEEYPVGGSYECIFDLVEGLPEYLEVPTPPSYEKARSVVCSDYAAAAAAVSGQALTGWSRVDVGVQKPRYRIPTVAKLPNAMTERHKRLLRNRVACLLYEVSVNDATSYNETTKGYDRFVQVYVDAETGNTIAVNPVYLSRGAQASNTATTDASGEWTLGKAKGHLTPAQEHAPESGTTVRLNAEHKWLVASYDKKRNLLWFKENDGTRIFQPDRDLEKALKAYKPTAAQRQPELKAPAPKE